MVVVVGGCYGRTEKGGAGVRDSYDVKLAEATGRRKSACSISESNGVLRIGIRQDNQRGVLRVGLKKALQEKKTGSACDRRRVAGCR